ncbi:MAG TPA: MRP family ATP-binding protein [Nitrospirae bacterium]|nr:MRP family ATP-binding protein [Nitrospirota bacterium]
MITKEQVSEALSKVTYPGFNKDIISTGAVLDIDIKDGSITVSVRPISADNATISSLAAEIKAAVAGIAGGGEVTVAMGGQAGDEGGHSHAPAEQGTPFVRNKLPGVKHIVPVSSGKGGVGKSTTAVNLAFSLSQLGYKTGILDLDIFGPSIHKMLGATEKLEIVDNMIVPASRHGLKVISVGMAVEDAEAMILRGPMVMKLIDQLINQVTWGELDYLIVDLPPGTGDVPLSLTQQVAVTGVVVVTTPQDVALMDVRRSVSMFQKTGTHILGLVENMSYYVCEKCGDIAHVFGKDGGKAESEKLGVPLLGSIPLTKSICEEADKGSPVVDREKSPELFEMFEKLAREVIERVDTAPEPAGPVEAASGIGQGQGGGCGL